MAPSSPTIHPCAPSDRNVIESIKPESRTKECQERPPSEVVRIVPLLPSAHARDPSLRNATGPSHTSEPMVSGNQEPPPSAVKRTVPNIPAAHPWSSSGRNTMEFSRSPRHWRCQELPPSEVAKRTPMPATHPCRPSLRNLTSVNPTGNKSSGLPCRRHERPPSEVARIVAGSPTAHPCRPSGKKLTDLSVAFVPLFWESHERPASEVVRIVP